MTTVLLQTPGAGTWTVPVTCPAGTVINVENWGAGSGASGRVGTNFGAAGGAGAWVPKQYMISAADVASGIPYVIGAGSSGTSGSNPSAGGDTTFGTVSANLIPNSNMLGATSGTVTSSAQLPVNMDWNSPASPLAVTLAQGVASGFNYIDIHFSGTPSDSELRIYFIVNAPVLASNSYTGSMRHAIVAGSTSGITFSLQADSADSGGGFLSTVIADTVTPTGSLTQTSGTGVSDASAAFLTIFASAIYTPGVPINCTWRLAAPQLELGGSATTFKPTPSFITAPGGGAPAGTIGGVGGNRFTIGGDVLNPGGSGADYSSLGSGGGGAAGKDGNGNDGDTNGAPGDFGNGGAGGGSKTTSPGNAGASNVEGGGGGGPLVTNPGTGGAGGSPAGGGGAAAVATGTGGRGGNGQIRLTFSTWIAVGVISIPTLRCVATALQSKLATATVQVPTLRVVAAGQNPVPASARVNIPTLRVASTNVTVNATATVATTAGATSLTNSSLTIAPGATALLAWLSFNEQSISASGETVNWDNAGTPQPMTQVAFIESFNVNVNIQLWGLVNPTIGNKNLTASWTGSVPASLNAIAFNGTINSNTTAAFSHAASSSGTTGSPTITIGSAVGDMVIVAEGNAAGAITSLTAPGSTSVFNYTDVTPYGYTGSRAPGVTPNVTFTGAPTSTEWAVAGVDVAAGAGSTAGQTLVATSTNTIALRAVGTLASINIASGLAYVTGFDCDATAYLTKVATAVVNIPTLRVASVAKMDNLTSALVPLTSISSVVDVELVNGGVGVSTLALSSSAVAGQSNLASAVVTLTAMSCSATGPNTVVGKGTIQISAVGVASTPNAAAGQATLVLSVVSSAIQEDLASSVNTLTIASVTNINPSAGGGSLAISAVASAIQENLASLTAYVTGFDSLVAARLDIISTLLGQLPSLNAAATAKQETFVSGVFTPVMALSANIVVNQYNLAVGIGEIELGAIVHAGQEKFASASIVVTSVSANVVVGAEVIATAVASLGLNADSSSAGQEVLAVGAINIPTPQAVVVCGMEAIARGTGRIVVKDSAQAGQEVIVHSSNSITLQALGIFGQNAVASASANVPTLRAFGLAGQGNVLSAISSIVISASATVDNPLAVIGSGTLSISAQGNAGQEALCSGNVLTTSLSAFVRGNLEVLTNAVSTLSISAASTATLSTNAAATVTLPTLQATSVAYNGWVGTALATIPSLSAIVEAQQTYGVSGTNTLTIVASVIAGGEVLATASSTLTISCQASVFTGQIATAVVNVPTLTAAGQAILTDTATGFSTILLAAFGQAYLSTLGQATGTLHISARGRMYATPPGGIESEEIVYIDTDDRVVYVTE